jgi:peptidoglycan/xylan/chitin deacetylase (PgdA/CDA1 family)
MKKISPLALLLFIGLSCLVSSFISKKDKPKISFSFDDGSIRDFPNHKNSDWNQQLLNNLKKHNVKAILYVKGSGLDNKKGKAIIKSWDESGHLIGNHTYNHPNYNKTSFNQFKNELLKNDSLINGYSNYTKFFRFPYLKEGNTSQKRDDFRNFLNTQGYKIGHVTIDASDWYIDSRLTKRLQENPNADISNFKIFYIKHLFERAQYYDSLGISLTGRQINHNLLLHHNLSAALFLNDLIQYFKDHGWEIVDIDKAYQDKFYKQLPKTIPAGESLIWALAKLSGKYESTLRYPGEDSRYEKDKMDKLGL